MYQNGRKEEDGRMQKRMKYNDKERERLEIEAMLSQVQGREEETLDDIDMELDLEASMTSSVFNLNNGTGYVSRDVQNHNSIDEKQVEKVSDDDDNVENEEEDHMETSSSAASDSSSSSVASEAVYGEGKDVCESDDNESILPLHEDLSLDLSMLENVSEHSLLNEPCPEPSSGYLDLSDLQLTDGYDDDLENFPRQNKNRRVLNIEKTLDIVGIDDSSFRELPITKPCIVCYEQYYVDDIEECPCGAYYHPLCIKYCEKRIRMRLATCAECYSTFRDISERDNMTSWFHHWKVSPLQLHLYRKRLVMEHTERITAQHVKFRHRVENYLHNNADDDDTRQCIECDGEASHLDPEDKKCPFFLFVLAHFKKTGGKAMRWETYIIKWEALTMMEKSIYFIEEENKVKRRKKNCLECDSRCHDRNANCRFHRFVMAQNIGRKVPGDENYYRPIWKTLLPLQKSAYDLFYSS